MVDKWAWCTVLLYWLDTNLCHLEQMRINHLFPLISSTLRCVCTCRHTCSRSWLSVYLNHMLCHQYCCAGSCQWNLDWEKVRSSTWVSTLLSVKSVAVRSLALGSGFKYVGRRWRRKSRNAPSRWKCLKQNGTDSKVCPHKGDIICWTSKRAVEIKQNKTTLRKLLSFRNSSWKGALH